MNKKRAVALVLAALMLPGIAFAGDQTVPNGISRIGGPVFDQADIDVAVIDSGIDAGHPDLNVVAEVDCTVPTPEDVTRFSTRLTKPGFGRGMSDHPKAHGTHVAGTIAALDNGIGVVGVVPGARIWDVRVFNDDGYGDYSSVQCAAEWVRDHADVIDVANMSLGMSLGAYRADEVLEPCRAEGQLPDPRVIAGEMLTDPFHQAICEAVGKGVVFTVAAGNSDTDAAHQIPAAYPEVVTVSNFADLDGKAGGLAGYLDCDGFPAFDDTFFGTHSGMPYSSSWGEAVDVSAPGTCVLSTVPDFGYAYFTGTSMASPHAAGVMAAYVIAAGGIDDAEGVEMLKAMMLESSENQPEAFHDPDIYPEPLLRLP